MELAKFDFIDNFAKESSLDPRSNNFAIYLDQRDPLRNYRSKFNFPINENGKDYIYMNGNSLGLMPKEARVTINEQLDKWSTRANKGHFEEPLPWLKCDEYLVDDMADIVGAKPNEVALMNQLTVNLHLMLVSFYRPTKKRHKIMCEFKAFPSDHFAFESQIEFHGYDPKESLLCIKPRNGEDIWRTEDIVKFIQENGSEIALVCLSGVHYYSGQLFDIATITKVAHQYGCMVGWDLAHAVGNVILNLHEWNVDFAVWCTYKYLNAGAGGIGGIFVHENHLKSSTDYPYLRGWWGHEVSSRMKMSDNFIAEKGALRFRISNTSFTAAILLQTSLKIFKEAGMKNLRTKSIMLTNYLEYLLQDMIKDDILKIITPDDVQQRGAQLSFKYLTNVKELEDALSLKGLLADYREPGVVRLAPCPLYNSFKDVYDVFNIIYSLK